MSTLTTKCAAAASILALISPASPDQPEAHYSDDPTLATATGYIRREMNGVVLHAVSWNGVPGVETVLRENGPRSRGFWRDWREWRATCHDASLETHGTRVCEILLHHFGPYDKATAQALSRRRKLEEKKSEVAQSLNIACPPTLRSAAWEYLGGPVAPLPLIPAASLVDCESFALNPPEPSNSTLEAIHEATIPNSVLSHGELVLRAHIAMTPEVTWPRATSLDEVAINILARARPFENAIDEIDRALVNTPLPPIPGEGSLADPDLIPYGRLICRHRAVIAAIPLALAGFDIELVNGSREVGGIVAPHLFIYCHEIGVLEASSNGPAFWMKPTRSSGNPALPLLDMEDGSRYRFYHRTKLAGR